MTDDTTLDMLELARFATLSGANRLVAAFAGIPEGPMRESVIHMAETLAATYAGAPMAQRRPEPIGQKDRTSALKLTSRTGRHPPTESPEADVVKMRMSGMSVVEIVQQTGISKDTIYRAVNAARAAGLALPTRKRQEGTGAPWHTSIDSLTPQGMKQVVKAAHDRGVTPHEYMERRQLALKLAQDGASYDVILKQTGEKDPKLISSWLSLARGAGIRVPYVTFLQTPPDAWRPKDAPAPEPEPEPVIDAVHAPVGRVFPPTADVPLHVRLMIRKAAARRSMTVEAYEDLRESIVRHRMNGTPPGEIARMTGEPRFFIRDIIDAAKARGVTFPPAAMDDEANVKKAAAG